MVNVCLAWIDEYELDCFALKRFEDGMIIAFVNSVVFSDIDELHLLYNKNTEFVDQSDSYQAYINKICLERK